MTKDKELDKLIEEGKKVWPIISKLAPYKNKTLDDYINYIKSSYYYYKILSDDEKKEFNKVKQDQFKRAIDAIDNKEKDKNLKKEK